ncbi:MAG: hypothetical protein AAFN77_09375 [Planctomycetota bacterium]
MARRRRKQNKKSMAGFWVLESIVVIGFAALFFNAQAVRQAAMEDVPAEQITMAEQQDQSQSDRTHVSTSVQVDSVDANGDWQNHRPRFSQVVGEIWDGGF